MGFVGSMFSDDLGAGFHANQANLQQAVTQDQTNQAYQNSQEALKAQQALNAQLAAQGGIQNQSNVFNQQQALAAQLQAQTQGAGPNPAQAMLSQATGANTANQAALMASQRGAGANPALIARLAAQQGAANQQGAIGQAATMRANQQLAAQGQLQGQQQMLGALATQQVGQQQQGVGAQNQFAQNEQQNLLNAVAAYNQAQVGNQAQQNEAQSRIAGINAQNQGAIFGGAMSGAASAFGVPAGGGGKAHGGMIHSYADGGVVEDQPQSFAGKTLGGFSKGFGSSYNHSSPGYEGGYGAGSLAGKGLGLGIGAAAQGISSLFSPTQPQPTYGPPNLDVAGPAFSQGGSVKNFKPGGKVPGKAKVEGDSLQNDSVRARLSPGEIVIPRSVVQSEDPIGNAARFVHETLNKEKNFAEGGEATTDQPTINIINSPSGQASQAPQAAEQGEQIAQLNPAMLQKFKGVSSLQPQQTTQQITQEENPFKQVDLNIQPKNTTELKNLIPGPEVYQQPVEQQTKAIEAEAAAKGKLGKIQSQAYQQQANQLASLQQKSEEAIAHLMDNIHKTTQDIDNGHIEPNRVYQNMSVPAKISTAIGMILGGIGGALTHQENPAMKFLQSQIDRDVAAQQAELGKKETLLSSYYKQYGNIQDATAMAKATLASLTAAKLEKAASFATNSIEAERARQAASQIRLGIAPAVVETGRNQALISQASQGGSDQASLDAYKARFLAPKGKEEAVEKDLKEFQDLRQAKQEALDAFDKAASMNNFVNRGLNPIQSSKRIGALIEPIIADTAKFSVNKFTEADQHAIRNLFSTLGANDETIATQRAQLASLFDKKMHFPSLVGVGINTQHPTFQARSQPGLNLAKR